MRPRPFRRLAARAARLSISTTKSERRRFLAASARHDREPQQSGESEGAAPGIDVRSPVARSSRTIDLSRGDRAVEWVRNEAAARLADRTESPCARSSSRPGRRDASSRVPVRGGRARRRACRSASAGRSVKFLASYTRFARRPRRGRGRARAKRSVRSSGDTPPPAAYASSASARIASTRRKPAPSSTLTDRRADAPSSRSRSGRSTRRGPNPRATNPAPGRRPARRGCAPLAGRGPPSRPRSGGGRSCRR